MNKIKGYKAFNKGLKCRDMQYEVGKTYKMDNEPNCCEEGYHLCENPLDTLDYYSLIDSEFAEVEAIGKISRKKDSDDTKLATNKIKIGAKLDLKGFVQASVDFLIEHCKPSKEGEQASSGYNSKLASSGYNSQLASSGDNSQLASSGYNSKLASSGDNSQLASSGYNSQLASSGDNSKLASSGYNSKLASSGYNSQLASSGYNSQLASSGDYSQLASSGYYSKVEHTEGKPTVVCNIGVYGRAKGIKGDILVLAEYKELDLKKYKTYVYKPLEVKSIKVDGKKIKENTFYHLEDGQFKED